MLLDALSPADAAYRHAGGVRTFNGVREYVHTRSGSVAWSVYDHDYRRVFSV